MTVVRTKLSSWKTRSLLGALGVLLGATLLAACSSGSSSANSLTLYNAQHLQTTTALVNAFEQQTGIKVSVRNDDEDVFANQIVTEGAHSPADVFFTENTPPLVALGDKGLLAPVAPATLARTPSQYNSSAGDWVGVSARVSVMDYNTSIVSPSSLPSSVMQLANPEWKGKLGLAPGETDFQPIVTVVAQTYGDAAALTWLEGLKANAAGHIYPDNESLVAAIGKGQVGIGVINQYYWYRANVENPANAQKTAIATFADGDPGYIVDVSGAGILASSSHKAAAQRFLAFLTSAKGQEIIAHSDSYEYPIASGVTTAKNETPLSQLHPNPVTVNQLGDGSKALALLQQAQLL
jgi:iron(III) transport system substrate-binding protein